MEDQGSHGDRNAGFGSTDGQWHHIAVTWESSTGIATLYLDGRKVRPPSCLAHLSASPLILMTPCHPADEQLTCRLISLWSTQANLSLSTVVLVWHP